MMISLIIAVLIVKVTISSLSTLSNGENSGDDETLKKGPWTAEEDEILAAYVTANGGGNWNIVQKNTGLARCGKSCRLRWTNHLRPDLKKGAFTMEEQQKIIEFHALWGNKWARMAQELPGRTDNEIKNFWNTRAKKRKRVNLPEYPDGIKPVCNINNQESNSAFTRHANVSPQTGKHACSSGPTSKSELPPFPSIDDVDTPRDDIPPETQFYQKNSPRNNGDLESILYPPKSLDESDNFSMLGQTSNSQNTENLDHIDLSWLENYYKDHYGLENTLFNFIDPFLPKNTNP